ncbi:MAG TPA: AzlD domain-containing protein [Steroidobacteraceae bacterium]|nr:AzlD domain-containing protein [Steroidobacteraceae bacterium]
MTALEVWLTIAGISLATLLTRASLLVTNAEVRIPPRVETALRYAPVCALAGIIVPDVLVSGGQIALAIGNLRLIATCIAVAIFLVTRSVIGTIAGGMGAFWLLRTFMGEGP